MKRCFMKRIPAMLAVFGAAPVLAQPAPIVIRADARASGTPVSPYLYGVFFEEINHAGDGGLYGELVRNRSFEDGRDGTDAWALNVSEGGSATWRQDRSPSVHANNPTSLRLEITSNPGEVTLSNTGYWGITLRKGKRYDFSLLARATPGFRGPIEVRLQDRLGKTLAKAPLTAPGADWKRQTAVLKPTADATDAHLVLATRGVGTVFLDMVSLFPETYKNRPNGLRPDLATTVAAMRPAFLRFPGGCFVEGETMASAFRWKNTIGPIESRPSRACLWGYRSTEGLGYHEYLQFCEDVGAVPLLVVNCGMAHRDVVPMAEMGPWVQDALDAIEYANGPVTSKWGALRAQQGHPKPFGLKFIEIGNENGGPAYDERFALFVDALRKHHPEVRIIADLWGGAPKSRPYDLIDEHYYSDPDFFFRNARRYDDYPRTGPKVYVGEYAVTQGAGTGNLHAALGEAAFMIGMERNADVVSMSSYAPLFVRAENRAWNPDAIVFNSGSVFGTPSYHVQRLFAHARPEVSLPTTLEMTEASRKATSLQPPLRGAVGLGTWDTQAEFRDVTVTGVDGTPFPLTGERIVSGTWNRQGDVLSQTESGNDRRIMFGDASWGDYTLSLKARKTGGAEGFLILFRAGDDRNLYWWNLGGWGNTRHAVERMHNGGKSIPPGAETQGRIETGRWYDIRVEVRGPRIVCFLDGKAVHTFEEPGTPLFHAVVGRAGRDYVLKVVNGAETAQTAVVALSGRADADAGTVMAEITTLTGEALSAENSFETPERIAPRRTKAALPVIRENGSPAFRLNIAPRSVTVVRWR
ncbi:MAG: alpha-L-arabinofuranosidase C-terminal domain-containing protein [Capsulimonadales bacterium]|nr:alpha-L-arabinofuranosidase C-terminal domain-containing protein [Capsulimonadales bacterium]